MTATHSVRFPTGQRVIDPNVPVARWSHLASGKTFTPRSLGGHIRAKVVNGMLKSIEDKHPSARCGGLSRNYRSPRKFIKTTWPQLAQDQIAAIELVSLLGISTPRGNSRFLFDVARERAMIYMRPIAAPTERSAGFMSAKELDRYYPHLHEQVADVESSVIEPLASILRRHGYLPDLHSENWGLLIVRNPDGRTASWSGRIGDVMVTDPVWREGFLERAFR